MLTVVILGGNGNLGRALVANRPLNKEARIINVSRGQLIGKNVINCSVDLLGESPAVVVKRLTDLTDIIDVLICAAYSKNYSSIRELNQQRFLEELTLDIFLPLKIADLCARHFWSKDVDANRHTGRKIINVSSAAAFGVSVRPELASYSGAKAALNVMTEYLHEYVQSSFGASAHIIAPGSFNDPGVLDRTIRALWSLAFSEGINSYTCTRIR